MAALAVVQPSEGGRSPLASRSAVRTIATAPRFVLGVAQDGRYLAWAPLGRFNGKRLCAKEIVVIQDLRTGRRTEVPAHPGCMDEINGPPWGLALAGSRAYWMRTTLISNESETDALVSASLHDAKLRTLGGEEIGRAQDWVFSQPPVSDGKRAYFWSTSPGHEIVSFEGSKRVRFSGSIPIPADLAAGGGRFARAGYSPQRDVADSPAWSPNGQQIAYTRYGSELWLVNVNGTGRRLIAAHGTAPDWSPDGTKLAFDAPHNNVVITNADGSDPQVVTSGTNPAWSPDGRELAVENGGSIWIVSADGQNRRLVIRDGAEPDWSPDGSQLVFITSHDHLTVANADGSDERTLVAKPVYGGAPAWSPDGSEIAFNGGWPVCGHGNLVCEVRPDGTGLHPLPTAAGQGYDPAWGPAPGEIVYTEADSTGNRDSHLAIWPGGRQVTTASPQVIRVYAHTGRKIAQFDAGGEILTLAVSSRVTAAVIRDPRGGWSIRSINRDHAPSACPQDPKPSSRLPEQRSSSRLAAPSKRSTRYADHRTPSPRRPAGLQSDSRSSADASPGPIADAFASSTSRVD
jgi:hypothetical protein